jgi:hypothetical protein
MPFPASRQSGTKMSYLQEDMKIAQDEIFGPVMSLMKFKCVKLFTNVIWRKLPLFWNYELRVSDQVPPSVSPGRSMRR